MRPQLLQDLTILPPFWHGPVRRLEVAHGLRPFALGGVFGQLILLPVKEPGVRRGAGRAGCNGGVGGGVGLFLAGPVVDVPVVLVEEEVVLGQFLGCHCREILRRKGGEEKIRLEGSALPRLVFREESSLVSLNDEACRIRKQ